MNSTTYKFIRLLNRVLKMPVLLMSLALFSYSNLFAVSRLDSLKAELGRGGNDTTFISLYCNIANEFLNQKSNPDSALFYLNKALGLSDKYGNKKHLYSIYGQFAQLFSKSGNYSISLEYYFKILKLLDDESARGYDTISIDGKYANTFIAIGTTYFNMENNTKALEYYLKSLQKVNYLAKLDPKFPANEKRLIIFVNMGGAYLSSRDPEKARLHFEKALEMNRPLNNQVNYGVLYNNLGIVYKEKKDFAKAFDYYNKCLDIRTRLSDSAGLAQVYNNLGDYYYLTGDYNKAVEILNKALLYSQKTENIRSQMKAANFLSMTYEKINKATEALAMHKLFKQLNDSIINSEQIQNTARLELQYQYEKQRKESELQQEIQLARKERKALIYLIIAGLLLFSFVIVVLLNRNQRIKMKQSKLLQESLELESKNLNLEKQNLELELEFRNKELATHVMYLLKKNEFIGSITEKLLSLKPLMLPENKLWMQDIVKEMKSNIDNTVWGEFEVRFQQVHRDFYINLSEKYPDLTPNETKLCAFLRLNMTTKDISAITFQSLKSIQVARARLRKKMDITRDDNLVSLLQQL